MAEFRHKIRIGGKDDASPALRAVGKSTQGLLRKAADLTIVFIGLARVVKGIGKVFQVTGRAIGAIMGEFTKFERGMAEVATITSLSTEEMKGLGKEVQAFSEKYAVGFEDAAGALYGTISAGISATNGGAEAFAVMGQSLKFGKAALMEGAEAVDLLTTVMNGYSLKAKDAERVSDILFTTIRLGKTRGSELAASLGRVTPIAKAAGVSLEDMSGAMVVLTRAGISTEEATTGLRALIASIAAPTESAEAAIEKLGLTLFNQGTLAEKGGLFKILEQLRDKAGSNIGVLSDVIPNIRALASALAAAGQEDAIPEIMRELGNASGATETALAKMMATLGFEIDRLKIAWSSLLINLGTFISQMPVVKGLLVIVSGAMSSFGTMLADNEGLQKKWNEKITEFVNKTAPGFLDAISSMVTAMISGKGGGLVGALRGTLEVFSKFGQTVALSVKGWQFAGEAFVQLKAAISGDNKALEESQERVADLSIAMDGLSQKLFGLSKEEERNNEALVLLASHLKRVAKFLRKLDTSTKSAAENLDAMATSTDTVAASLSNLDPGNLVALSEAVAEGTVGGILDQLNERLIQYQEDVKEFGAPIGAALGDSITNALLDKSVTWKEQFESFGTVVKSTMLDAFLEPIIGVESMFAELFSTIVSPFRALGSALNEMLFKPLITGFLNFFGFKTAAQKAAAIAEASTAAATAAAIAKTHGMAVAAMMPGLGAAASLALIASFGGAGAATGLLPGLVAKGIAEGAAAGTLLKGLAHGGRVTEPTFALVGEAGPEMVIPENRPARARELIGDLAGRRPDLFGGGGGASVVVNLTSYGDSPESLARLLSDQINAELGAITTPI